MNIKDIKYVYFDMDGTLLMSNRTISHNSLNTIDKLRKANICCSIATGRPYYFALNEIRMIKPVLPVVSCNGALIFDPVKRQLISNNSINKNVAKKIYEILVQNDAVFLIYAKDKMWMYKNDLKNPTSGWFTWVNENNKMLPRNEQIVISKIENNDSFDITKYDVFKFLVIFSEMPVNKYLLIKNEILNFDEIYVVKSQKEVFDIMSKNSSKGLGLKMLHDKGLIDLNKTLVFGDAENDLSMFKIAKWSVAMGNAQQEIKDAAMFVCGDNNSDGISKFFEKLFKNEN